MMGYSQFSINCLWYTTEILWIFRIIFLGILVRLLAMWQTRPSAVSLAFCSRVRRVKHVLKMATIIPFAISDNSQYSIYSSPDGVLKLWEADNGVLKQEYTPSAHLSATCTCLSWGPKRNLVHEFYFHMVLKFEEDIWICALYI